MRATDRRMSGWLTAGALFGAGLALAGVGEAYGQQSRVNLPSQGLNSTINIGRLGDTEVQRLYRGGVTFGGAGASNIPEQQRRGMTVFGRRMGRHTDLLAMQRTAAIQQVVREGWVTRLAPGGAARYIREHPRLRSGRNSRGLLSGTNASPLLSTDTLVATTAFTAPAYYSDLTSSLVRDPMFDPDQPGLPRFTTRKPYEAGGVSQAEVMQARQVVLREQMIEEAWERFREEDYLEARSAFRRAQILDSRRPREESAEPRIGMFYCAIAQRQYTVAVHLLVKLIQLDMREFPDSAGQGGPGGQVSESELEKDIFGPHFGLTARYSSVSAMTDAVREFVQFTNTKMREEKDKPRSSPTGYLAAASLAMWHAGLHSEAMEGARLLQKRDPEGAYGTFGGLLLKAAGENKGGSEGSS